MSDTDMANSNVATNQKMELKLSVWNSLVSDATQCMQLSPSDEVKFLSSRNANLAEYLQLHPEMAHELMVPSGFKQCLVRQYERYLGGRQLLSTQNGAADESGWDSEIFDTMLPGRPRVVSNPKNKVEPTWRELNTFVCRDAVDTVTGEEMAPHYEYKGSGERVRIIRYNTMEVEVTAKQFHLMWDHVVCQFSGPASTIEVEFIALHRAWHEISGIGNDWNEWNFPIGQQIEILKKQLEHRLCVAHIGRPNPCSACCPFRPTTSALPKSLVKEHLTKTEAADLVCKDRIKKKMPTSGVAYDPEIRKALDRQSIH